MPNKENTEEIQGHLALAAGILENICNQVGLDLDGTSMNLSNPKTGQAYGAIPLSKMIKKWKELSA